MQQASKEQFDVSEGDLREAARRNWAYFTVARKLLEPGAEAPQPVRREVNAELKLIKAHAGSAPSPLFDYYDDYSQYIPRGHYAGDERLEEYFRAMMWYGRITMLLWGPDDVSRPIVSQEVADRQTRQAALIASALFSEQGPHVVPQEVSASRSGLPPPPWQVTDPREIWNRIYTVTAFFVGLADDLTPVHYSQVLEEVLGASYKWQALADPGNLKKLREQLRAAQKPRIYGGLGAVPIPLPLEPEDVEAALRCTQGMRLFGRRFVADSYFTGRLVGPTLGSFTGHGRPFSIADSHRMFPRGLDVLSVMGSVRAEEVLQQLGDADYENYDQFVRQLRGELSEMGANVWHQNLYWGWLHSLKALLDDKGNGWPTFMQTQAWQDKDLNTALASWTALRRDTVLYAKQACWACAAPRPKPEEPVVGYVEPAPELYARLLGFTRMMTKVLHTLRQREYSEFNKSRFEVMLEHLLAISEKELAGKKLSDEEYLFIKRFGDEIIQIVTPMDDEDKDTRLVTDVFTNSEIGQIVEEGTGYLRVMVVAYKLPQGNIVLGAGPVLSYYEFKHPMSDRLTDEAWKVLLQSDKAPSAPEWTQSFYVGK